MKRTAGSLAPHRIALRHTLAVIVASVTMLAWSSLAAAISITGDSLSVIDFDWSPDDQTIAFNQNTSGGRCWLARAPASGGAITVLTNSAGDYGPPHWTADGAYLLTTFDDVAGYGRIGAIDATTGALAVSNPNLNRWSPSFWQSRTLRSVLGVAGVTDSTQRLVVMDLIAGRDSILPAPGTDVYLPSWSSAFPGYVYWAPDAGGVFQVWSWAGGAATPVQLTSATDSLGAILPEVAHDGSVLFLREVAASPAPGDSTFFQLFTRTLNGTITPLTTDRHDHSRPTWHPSNCCVAYARADNSGHANIFMLDVRSRVETQVTFGPEPKRRPKFSNSGTSLAYLQLDMTPPLPGFPGGEVWHLYSVPNTTAVPLSGSPPVPIELQQNYPNPFNPATTIAYSVPSQDRVRIRVANVRGEWVATLVDQIQGPGQHTVPWFGFDHRGRAVASGIYYYTLEIGGKLKSRSMVLLR